MMHLAPLLLSLLTVAESASIVLSDPLRFPTHVGRDAEAETRRGGYSAAQWKAMHEGTILMTDEAPKGREDSTEERSVRAAAIIPFPPELVWAVLVDFESRPDFLPGAKEIRIVRVEGNRVWLSERLRFLLVTIRNQVINTLEPERGLMSWVLDKSVEHDIADTVGAWQLTALETVPHTLVTYRAWVDTGQPVPGFLEDFLLKRSLPQLIEGLRNEVQRRATDR